MTNEEKMMLLKLIFNSLFQSKQQNTDITKVMMTTNMGNFMGRWYSNNTLRGFDLSINLGNRIIDIRCVEQNPNKTDAKGNLKWTANLAQQGHKLMWVIDRNGGFLGRMQDEEWIPGFEPATQPAIQQPAQQNIQNAPAQTESLELDELPEIPNAADIPEYILNSVAEMEEEPPDWEGDY